ncbi:CHAP domain-containing protein [Alteriqipengyuania sp. 357]
MSGALSRFRCRAERIFLKSKAIFAASCLIALAVGPVAAQARHLQCVPYARQVSGIQIHGNALTWWGQADGRYPRGGEPQVGAVLAFRPTGAMPLGHVAVVSAILDDRRILLDHANWSGPGVIDSGVLAIDVSAEGDWSSVRVWYGPSGGLGSRHNPTFGFIYKAEPEPQPEPTLARSPAPQQVAVLKLPELQIEG